MPAKKTKNNKSGGGKNKKGGADTDVDNTKISTIKNFTSSRSPSPVNITGSMPKSSESLKPQQASTTSSMPLFSATNKSRLLSVPASAAASAVSAASVVSNKVSNGSKVFKYIIGIFILAFLVLTLYLYLEKPKTTDITHLYDPVTKFFTNLEKKPDNNSGIKKLENLLNEKKVVNNIDNKGTGSATGTAVPTAPPKKEKNYKKKPVIPEADDSTSLTQMKPKSKKGFCYIGEDRGFRSCIDVDEGDICMSGDIFPTQAICINPNLRE
jgi:hypothetical protein